MRRIPSARSTAGCQPATRRARAGVTTELDRPAGPLLGATRSARYETATVVLDADDVLTLYTDGLIEHRDRTLAEGLVPVMAVLDQIFAEGSRRPLEDLLVQLPRANPEDDTCVLAARPVVAEQPGR